MIFNSLCGLLFRLRLYLVMLLLLTGSPTTMSNYTYMTRRDGARVRLGRDVCVVEDVPGLNITFPLPWTHGIFCTHPTYLRQQCCEGYAVAALEFGCPVVETVDLVLDAIEPLGGNRFHRIIGRNNLPLILKEQKQDLITVLLPIDKGFKSMDDFTVVELSRKVEVGGRHISPLLLYHLLPRRWYTSQLSDGQRLKTLLDDNTIVVTKLSDTMVLFNCIPVHRVDIHGRNGVIHVLSKPLHPAYAHSLNDLISHDPQLSMFLTLLGYADLLDWIRVSGPLTVFAPTNDALNRLPIRFLDSITYDVKYFDALQAIVKNHLVDGTVCSLGLGTQVDLKTLEGEELPVNCDATYTVSFGRAILTTQDLVAKNGVLHHIDRVLVPPKGYSILIIESRK